MGHAPFATTFLVYCCVRLAALPLCTQIFNRVSFVAVKYRIVGPINGTVYGDDAIPPPWIRRSRGLRSLRRTEQSSRYLPPVAMICVRVGVSLLHLLYTSRERPLGYLKRLKGWLNRPPHVAVPVCRTDRVCGTSATILV